MEPNDEIAEVISQRLNEIENGKVQLVSGRDTMARLQAKINKFEEESRPTFRPYRDDITEHFYESWWPSHIRPQGLPPFTIESWQHVLDGDYEKDGTPLIGGGHLWESVLKRKFEGKTSFPRHWGAAQVGSAVAQVLRIAAGQQGVGEPDKLPQDSEWQALVTIDGARLVVFVSLDWDVAGHGIITAYPVRGDGVERLRQGRMVPQPLLESER